MGWQDAPIVGGQSNSGATPAWMNAPLVNAPAQTSSAPQDLGTTALWNKPADTSWGDYLLAHLAKPFQGANQAAQDYSRTAVDAATFGLGDRLQSKLTGNPLEQERADTNAAYGRLGAMAPIVSGAMYGMGPGELGMASKLGGAVAPAIGRWAGGVVGSGAEGALAGGAGALGHDENVGTGALGGLGVGMAGGVLGGVVGRGGTLPPAASAADLKTEAQKAYAPLSNILYDATKEVHPSLDVTNAQNALRDWSGYKWNDAAKTRGEINTLLDKPQLSANDIQQSQSYLKGIAKNPNSDPNDALYAGHYVGQLQDVLENGIPQTGVPPNVGPGYAAQVKAAGDALHGRAQDIGRLDDWIAKSQVAGGPDVGGQASAYLRTKPGQTFAKPGSPQYDALNTLAGTAQGPLGGSQGGLTLWDLKHHLLWPAVGLAGAQTAGAFGTAEGHQPWWANIPEDILGIGAGVLLKKGLGAAGMRAQARAADAARVALSTGQSQAPILPGATGRDALRNLIFGAGAAGYY